MKSKSLIYKAEKSYNETQGRAGNTETHPMLFISLYRLGLEAAVISFECLFP